jgi:hypothetical protein
VGQAAFTITVVVLFNLLVPAGWKVGLLRIEDVAIGCGVSLVVGVLFWPRGASSLVGDDLADAFRRGAAYLSQAVDWSLGLSQQAPDTAGATIAAGIRLDDALRLFLAEQGTKRVRKEDLWTLVMGTMRLRLTANSVADLRGRGAGDGAAADGQAGPALKTLRQRTADLAGFYERVADEVGAPRGETPAPVVVPDLHGIDGPDGLQGLGAGPAGVAGTAGQGGRAGGEGRAGQETDGSVPYYPRALWVREHLHQLGQHALAITAPAEHVAELRRVPWWR